MESIIGIFNSLADARRAAAILQLFGIPGDELYVYEDALRRGRSVVMAFTDNEKVAESARVALKRAGAESVDAAREEWWIGLRDAESEHYLAQGGDFKTDEAKYRLGFE